MTISLLSLPNDALRIIANKVNDPCKLRLVCKRWYHVVDSIFASYNTVLKSTLASPNEYSRFKATFQQLYSEAAFYDCTSEREYTLHWAHQNYQQLIADIQRAKFERERDSLRYLIRFVAEEYGSPQMVEPTWDNLIVQYTNLKKVQLTGSNFYFIPEEMMTRLQGLEELIISGTKLREIPSYLNQLMRLKKLKLKRTNYLREISPELTRITDLYIENISFVPIHHFSSITQLFICEIADPKFLFEMQKLPSLTNLIVDKSSLTENEAFGSLTRLKILKIFSCTISLSLAGCTNLKELKYFDPESEIYIPEVIFQLTGLTKLDLGSNCYKDIHPDLSQLTNLKSLVLYNNDLKFFPEAILRLTQIQELHLDYNNISEIPDRVADFPNLRALSMRGNCLSYVPPALQRLSISRTSAWVLDDELQRSNVGAKSGCIVM